jgi:hypothetical protein
VCNKTGQYPTNRDRERHVNSPEHLINGRAKQKLARAAEQAEQK